MLQRPPKCDLQEDGCVFTRTVSHIILGVLNMSACPARVSSTPNSMCRRDGVLQSSIGCKHVFPRCEMAVIADYCLP